jgi:hypothetical protein
MSSADALAYFERQGASKRQIVRVLKQALVTEREQQGAEVVLLRQQVKALEQHILDRNADDDNCPACRLLLDACLQRDAANEQVEQQKQHVRELRDSHDEAAAQWGKRIKAAEAACDAANQKTKRAEKTLLQQLKDVRAALNKTIRAEREARIQAQDEATHWNNCLQDALKNLGHQTALAETLRGVLDTIAKTVGYNLLDDTGKFTNADVIRRVENAVYDCARYRSAELEPKP